MYKTSVFAMQLCPYKLFYVWIFHITTSVVFIKPQNFFKILMYDTQIAINATVTHLN